MPLGAVVDKKYAVFHGGISPEIQLISQINEVQRFQETPIKGFICDLLWSDPIEKIEENIEFKFNNQ